MGSNIDIPRLALPSPLLAWLVRSLPSGSRPLFFMFPLKCGLDHVTGNLRLTLFLTHCSANIY